MYAITQDHYGPVENLQIESLAAIEPAALGAHDLLVEVHATSVTTADWRMRAADFPAGMRLAGRLFAGLLRPRNRITGREFAGRVLAVGAAVTRFAVGDAVFGAHAGGVNAEQIVVPEGASIARVPRGLSMAEAASLPFGALTAADFLIDKAKIQAGEEVLVLGASGGVGVYLVQLAKHLGAAVTAVCSGANEALVRGLGADKVIDYRSEDPRALWRSWDVIIDPVGKSDVPGYRSSLREGGRHVFIEAGIGEILRSMVSDAVIFGVTTEGSAAMERLCELVEAGAIRPVIGHRMPMTAVAEAHRLVERRHRRGAVILEWPAAGAPAEVVPLQRAV
ncbi:MAG: NAD(P)-dependent alcohol dehydrogenase [Myxococcales bacterium]|nr:NAD(P)-dependent alcohol dehydrogenase [Myxococcales bacterium]MCB9570136.1 NAD(P)-dependent alcohol dehydrogenase [Myxococcales bacterium]